MIDTSTSPPVSSTAPEVSPRNWLRAYEHGERFLVDWRPSVLDELTEELRKRDEDAALDHLYDYFDALLRAERLDECRAVLDAARPQDYAPGVALGFLACLSVKRRELEPAWTTYVRRLEEALGAQGFEEARIQRLLAPYAR